MKSLYPASPALGARALLHMGGAARLLPSGGSTRLPSDYLDAVFLQARTQNTNTIIPKRHIAFFLSPFANSSG